MSGETPELRMDKLIGDRWSLVAFKDLDRPHQLAMVWYMAIDGEAWYETVPEDCYRHPEALRGDNDQAVWHAYWNKVIEEHLDRFIEQYGDEWFGVAMFSREEMLKSIGEDEDFSHLDRAEVTKRIVGECSSPYPPHGIAQRRPVILSGDDYGTLEDGWHRVGYYIGSGVGEIPALFYPHDHHIAAHEKRTVPLWRCESSMVEGRRPLESDDWKQEGMRLSGQWDAMGRWFTNDPSTLQFYADDADGPVRVVRIDATPEEVATWTMANNPEAASFSRDHATEFFLPRDRANSAWRDSEVEMTLVPKAAPWTR